MRKKVGWGKKEGPSTEPYVQVSKHTALHEKLKKDKRKEKKKIKKEERKEKKIKS